MRSEQAVGRSVGREGGRAGKIIMHVNKRWLHDAKCISWHLRHF